MSSKIIVLLLFAVSCTVVASQNKPLVKSVKIKKIELFDPYNAFSQCQNEKSRTYYANISGTVELLSAKQGDTVNAGEIIIAIDKKIAEAAKVKAETILELAQLSYLRNKSLSEKNIISNESFEKSKIDLEVARVTFAEAIKTYNDMVITAPFTGQIGVVKARIGDRLRVGDYLFSIIEPTSPKNIFIQIPEFLYSKVSNITEVIITDTNGNMAKGLVSAVSQYLSNSGTIDVKVTIEDNNNFIHGSYVNAEFIINKHDGLVIPEQSLLKNDKGNFVYQIKNNNEVKQLYVELGSRKGNLIEIIASNLNEGDLIVLEGLTKVQDGSIISLID